MITFRQTVASLLIASAMLTGSTFAKDKSKAGENAQQNEDSKGKFLKNRGEHAPNPDAMLKVLDELNLTADQRKQIDQIISDAKDKMEAWREEHKSEFKKLKEAYEAAKEKGDRETLEKLGEQRRKLMDTAPAGKGQVIQQIKAVLTEQQIKQLEAKLEDLRKEMKERHDKHEGDKHEGHKPEGEHSKPGKAPEGESNRPLKSPFKPEGDKK